MKGEIEVLATTVIKYHRDSPPLYGIRESTCMSKESRRKKEILKLRGLSSPRRVLARDGDTEKRKENSCWTNTE